MTALSLLPNSARLLVGEGVAHLEHGGCGWRSGRMVRISLAQALVWVRPAWCTRCFQREVTP